MIITNIEIRETRTGKALFCIYFCYNNLFGYFSTGGKKPVEHCYNTLNQEIKNSLNLEQFKNFYENICEKLLSLSP